jgi:hypothetical protein
MSTYTERCCRYVVIFVETFGAPMVGSLLDPFLVVRDVGGEE